MGPLRGLNTNSNNNNNNNNNHNNNNNNSTHHVTPKLREISSKARIFQDQDLPRPGSSKARIFQGQAYGRMARDGDGHRQQRLYTLRAGGLWPSSTLLDAPRHTPQVVIPTPYATRHTPHAKKQKEIAIFHYQILFPRARL
jgi:hypothetical protein